MIDQQHMIDQPPQSKSQNLQPTTTMHVIFELSEYKAFEELLMNAVPTTDGHVAEKEAIYLAIVR